MDREGTGRVNRKGEQGEQCGWGKDGEKGGLENDICSRQPMHRAQSTEHSAQSTVHRAHSTQHERPLATTPIRRRMKG